MTKPFNIPKELMMTAYKVVKSNNGGPGEDDKTIIEFGKDLKKNLYKLWNRMSSGSYFPTALKVVEIGKNNGGTRKLEIPTVEDRIAQTVAKLILEAKIEPYFLEDSYGYRPNKSALGAIEVTRKRCWQYDWLVEFDIKGLFNNIPHTLIMKALAKHNNIKWIELYIKRWIETPQRNNDGTLKQRTKGINQGGVISPLLSNLFMHYVFDKWMERMYPNNKWCRYSDDGLVHCKTEEEARHIMEELKKRFKACGLELHEEKTKIVFCKGGKQKSKHPNQSFTFLGYTFRTRAVRNLKDGKVFSGFTPGISKEAGKAIREVIRSSKWHLRSDLTLEQIAQEMNPVLRGWINYYGHHTISELAYSLQHFNAVLVKWVRRKYKRYKCHKTKAIIYLGKMANQKPKLFAHWAIGITWVAT